MSSSHCCASPQVHVDVVLRCGSRSSLVYLLRSDNGADVSHRGGRGFPGVPRSSSSSSSFLLFSGPAASGSRGSSSPRLPGVGSFLFSVSLLFHSSSLTVTSTEPLRGGHSPANWHLFQRSTKRRARGGQRPALIDKSSPFWAEPAPLIDKSSPFWAGATHLSFFLSHVVSCRGAALLVLQDLWAVEPYGHVSSSR